MDDFSAGVVKVEKDARWQVFLFNPRQLAVARPLDILDQLENQTANELCSSHPPPRVLDSTVELLPNLETAWIADYTLSRPAISRLWTYTQNPEIEAPEDSCLLAFPRHHFSMHAAARIDRLFEFLDSPIVYDQQTLSTSEFHFLIKELDIQILKDIPTLLRDERYLTSGGSFEVAVAIARTHSHFPQYSDGTPRPQLTEGAVIALKRLATPLPKSKTDESSQFPRIHRSLIHELRILSHPPLRSHRNLINLFGVAWEKHQDPSGVEYMRPVILQSCASRGNLRDYLRAMRYDKQLSWDSKMLFCKDILDGLAALHASNIIHGDVKCENILLEEGPDALLVAKLTDFGFSVIIPRFDHSSGVQEVNVLGGTKEYMAPEVFIAIQTAARALPVSIAFTSDIYSFGLAACEIALDGQYIFSAVAGCSDDRDANHMDDWDEAIAKIWIDSKTKENADELLLQPAKELIEQVQGSSRFRLAKVLDVTFRRRAEDRAPNVASVSLALFGHNEAVDTDGVGDVPAIKGSSLSLSFLFKQRYEIFVINGQLVQLKVNDASMAEIKEANLTIVSQVLQDLQVKANTPLRLENPISGKADAFSLSDTAAISYCAYQMFKCHLNGLGVPLDLGKAVKYLKTSAQYGYAAALVAISTFQDLFPESPSKDDLPIEDALEAVVFSGPRTGMVIWLIASRILRECHPEAYQRAVKKLNYSGYAELGEARDCGAALDAECFTGADVGYQWIGRGTMPLVLRLLPILSSSEFISCFENGCLPSTGSNYNDETALYMCCRAGDAEKVLALLSAYEWARAQTSMANKQGRLPLHWLWAFDQDDVGKVATALLYHGADLHAVDDDNFRAIDYAILAHRSDVVSSLISMQKGMFENPQVMTKDLHTLISAINFAEVDIAAGIIQMANLQNLRNGFIQATGMDISTRVMQFGKLSRVRLTSLIRTAIGHFGPSDSADAFESVLTAAVASRSSDFIEAILDARIVSRFGSSKLSVAALCSAAQWSQLEVFKQILEVAAPLSLDEAHYTLGVMIQFKGQSQCAMVSEFVSFLNGVGMMKEAVNYRKPGSCEPDCTIDHTHFFYPTQFWNAIDEGAFEIARMLAPYEDTEGSRFPTTLFHVIETAKPEILKQLDFLFRLGPEYRRYTCDPVRRFNALHVVVDTYLNYTNPADFRSVLKTVLEWVRYYEEDINAPDCNGVTGLHRAAYTPSLDAVQLLTLYRADKGILDARGLTAYDYALHLARFVALEGSTTAEPGSSFMYSMQERRPRETEPHRVKAQFMGQLCNILALLSVPADRWRLQDAVGDVRNAPSPNNVVKGLVPISRNILFTTCTEDDSDDAPLQAWACLEEGRVGFRVNIRHLDEFTPHQLMRVRLKSLVGRDGLICEQLTVEPYLYQTEIYPIRERGEQGRSLTRFFSRFRKGVWSPRANLSSMHPRGDLIRR